MPCFAQTIRERLDDIEDTLFDMRMEKMWDELYKQTEKNKSAAQSSPSSGRFSFVTEGRDSKVFIDNQSIKKLKNGYIFLIAEVEYERPQYREQITYFVQRSFLLMDCDYSVFSLQGEHLLAKNMATLYESPKYKTKFNMIERGSIVEKLKNYVCR